MPEETPIQPESQKTDASAVQDIFANPPPAAKKEIIEEVTQYGTTGEMIYVMPEKFRKAQRKLSKKDKNKSLILILCLLIIIVGGGFAFYFWITNYHPNIPVVTQIPAITQPEENNSPSVPAANVSIEQTLKAEIKDQTGETVSWLEFYLPAGAVDQNLKIELISEPITNENTFNDYKVIGGTYKIQSTNLILQKSATLRAFYHNKIVESNWENDIVLGYLKDNIWTPLSSTQDVENNLIIAQLDLLPSDTFALIVSKSKAIPQTEIFQIAPQISSTVDSDQDSLTDTEETIYRTSVNNPDTDGDGISDGQEIANLTDPLQTGENKLSAAGLINIYTNSTFSYSFFYPSSWITRAIPETNNEEVLVITNTGEFFSATAEKNPDQLSLIDWYSKQSPTTEKSSLTAVIVNNQPALWSSDHLTIYISKGENVYVISYNVGTEKEANFKTTFKMLINSFQFIAPVSSRPNGTLIKYPDSAMVYLIENGSKRVFKSGEIFEKLGYKWENVIEIPTTETFPDGSIIDENESE
ncbi:MAG: thrombospondin type 3 repeat-containing protein [Patescibacteria group bacterium]